MTRKQDEQNYIEALVSDAESTVRFLRSEMKPDRERACCAALLRCLGVNFSVDELSSYRPDPPDVIFRLARFEVRQLLDRKQDAEWKTEAEKRKRAQSLNDLKQPYRPPRYVSLKELVPVVTQALSGKSINYYDASTLVSLDALVYIGLKDVHLDLQSIVPDVTELVAQGWRSVSILMPNHAVVLWADAAAPDFLYERCGLVKSEWKKPEGLFDM